MNKNELKKGEIYAYIPDSNTFGLTGDNPFIFVADPIKNTSQTTGTKYCVVNTQEYFRSNLRCYWTKGLRHATPEEKHWLNTCIEQNKFVSYEEAMKTFIPEYVECINNKDIPYGIIGRIYKFNNLSGKHWGLKCNLKCANYDPDTTLYFEIYQVKPSTKEAYDAQFVVKEPEFVLPEKWYIKIKSTEEANIYKDFFKKVKPNQNWVFWIDFIYGFNGINYTNSESQGTLITFEQFEKYVLKETEELSPLKLAAIEHPHLAKVESKPFEILSIINNITKEQLDLKKDGYFRSKFSSIHLNNVNDKYSIVSVANKEGNIFEIGDTIISTRSKKRFTNNVSKIVSFKMNVAKDNILIVGDHYYKTGVLISNIEHHLQDQIKVEPEFILPERWFLRFKTLEIFNDLCKKYKPHFTFYPESGICNDIERNVKLDNFYYLSNNGIFGEEITFEQFKKYVLKETEPVIIAQSHKDMLDLKTKGIDSIVLPQETLLEKAKRLYPIGTRFKNTYNFNEAIVKCNNFIDEISRIKLDNGMQTISAGNWTIYNKDRDEWAEIIGYEPQIGDKFNKKDFSYPAYGGKFGNSIYTIVKFQGSYDNPNSVITFRGDDWIGDHTSTVLLRNIKIIK